MHAAGDAAALGLSVRRVEAEAELSAPNKRNKALASGSAQQVTGELKPSRGRRQADAKHRFISFCGRSADTTA
jgi:hypothetical protein